MNRMETVILSRYVTRDDRILSGEPIIKGTRTPVRSIVEKTRIGYSPEDIVRGSPYLTLAQIYDALSYYYDNQAEIDDYIELNRVPEELIHPLVKNL